MLILKHVISFYALIRFSLCSFNNAEKFGEHAKAVTRAARHDFSISSIPRQIKQFFGLFASGQSSILVLTAVPRASVAAGSFFGISLTFMQFSVGTDAPF